MRILGLIPARGGSKRLPRKNILTCFGKPLIAWTIEAANKSKLISETWVSTDDKEITRISQECGAKVLYRPAELAQDSTTSEEVVDHALKNLPDFDWICLLQPTSPTRTAEAIDKCLKLAIENDSPVFSTSDQRTSNGAIYIWKSNTTLGEVKKAGGVIWFPMYCIDINTSSDFLAAADDLMRAEKDLLNPWTEKHPANHRCGKDVYGVPDKI